MRLLSRYNTTTDLVNIQVLFACWQKEKEENLSQDEDSSTCKAALR